MVAFGVIVLINNINVETKAYSQIAAMRNNAEFDNFYIRADRVKSTSSGDQCPYSAYANNATMLLNEGIDYYLVYLQDMDGMNRNDMNKLVKGYKAYIAQYNKAKRALLKKLLRNSMIIMQARLPTAIRYLLVFLWKKCLPTKSFVNRLNRTVNRSLLTAYSPRLTTELPWIHSKKAVRSLQLSLTIPRSMLL
jgi:hypothetical protein